jgi:hypothetical protein
MAARQEGQLALVRSQASTHAPWNPWPHPGSTRTLSPSANSVRHIAHSDVKHHAVVDGVDEDDESGETANKTVGSASMAFFLSPLGGGGEWSELEVRRRRHAQRETRARPRMQTSAQSSDARITTMFESTAIPAGAVCCCCSGVERGAAEEDVSPAAMEAAVRCRRRLAGARMVLVWSWSVYLPEL